MRDFAERLIAYETRGNKSSAMLTKNPGGPSSSVKSCVRIWRPSWATSVFVRSFRARSRWPTRKFPWLRAVQVKADGSLEGLDELEAQVDPDEIFEGCVVLLAQLLGLLVAFIGEDLTLRLVREVWPKLSLNDLDFGKGDKNEKTK